MRDESCACRRVLELRDRGVSVGAAAQLSTDESLVGFEYDLLKDVAALDVKLREPYP